MRACPGPPAQFPERGGWLQSRDGGVGAAWERRDCGRGQRLQWGLEEQLHISVLQTKPQRLVSLGGVPEREGSRLAPRSHSHCLTMHNSVMKRESTRPNII